MVAQGSVCTSFPVKFSPAILTDPLADSHDWEGIQQGMTILVQISPNMHGTL